MLINLIKKTVSIQNTNFGLTYLKQKYKKKQYVTYKKFALKLFHII
jgi:hypothetical protein